MNIVNNHLFNDVAFVDDGLDAFGDEAVDVDDVLDSFEDDVLIVVLDELDLVRAFCLYSITKNLNLY